MVSVINIQWKYYKKRGERITNNFAQLNKGKGTYGQTLLNREDIRWNSYMIKQKKNP